ncbi:serine/threonine-protein kinase [Calidifontibacter terrae]
MDETTAPELPGYDSLRRIGVGGSSEVWLVRRSDGQRLAAKLVDTGIEAAEQRLLERLDHDHVLRLHDVVQDACSGRSALITDLAEGGSLAACLAARDRLTPGEIVTVLSPIARTLHDLHALGLVHCDLSPANILMTAAGKPLIADLGVSRVAGHDSDLWVTERWAAPEVLAGEPAGPAADVHALGAIAWAALAGCAPPAAHERPDLAEVAAHAPARLLDLIDDAMAFDPGQRPTAGDFAVRLWDCASAEPAPVAGLVTSETQMDSPMLTRRVIREQLAADEEQRKLLEPPPTWRDRLIGHGEIAARRSLPALVAGGALTTMAALLWMLTSPTPSYAGAPALAATSPPAASIPVTTTPAPKPPSTPTTDLPVSALLRTILADRAAAWDAEDVAALDVALVPGSAAAQSDSTALQTAQQQGIDYRGVRFVVRSSAPAQRSVDRIVVTARVDRPSYQIVSSSTTRQVPATSAAVTFTLDRDGERWRISSWVAG